MKTPEHDLQVRCVRWFRYRYPYLSPIFFAVPNGGHRTKATAAMMKAEGERAGVADLILLLPSLNGHSLNIEMKAGTSQSPQQRIYELYCRSSDNSYIICHSLSEFQKAVEQHLSLVDKNILSQLQAIHRTIEAEKVIQVREKIMNRIKRMNHEDEK